VTGAPPLEIQIWPIDLLILYARNPRKNDAVVDSMCPSIREFSFKIPVLARSDGEVVDGHLRIKAARKLRINEIPVILCDEWTQAQVKAFRLMVNRSVSWASWDDDKANAAPPLPENPVPHSGDLWLCGPHRVLCGDATSPEGVVRLLGRSRAAADV
jgi:hypothetical protein